MGWGFRVTGIAGIAGIAGITGIAVDDLRLDSVWIDLFSGDFDEEVHLSRVDDEVGIRVSDRQSGPCNVDHFVDAGFGQQIQARQE